MRVLLLLLGVDAAASWSGAPAAPRRPALRRAVVRCGFSIEEPLEEMNPLSWPNVQKRQSDFDMTAGPDEIKLIYVQGGSATITDADGKSEAASPGQMVMVYDGSVRWTVTPDSGPLTLLSSEGIEYSDEEAEQAQAESDALQKPPDADLSLTEGAGLLAGLRVVPPRAPSTRVAHSRRSTAGTLTLLPLALPTLRRYDARSGLALRRAHRLRRAHIHRGRRLSDARMVRACAPAAATRCAGARDAASDQHATAGPTAARRARARRARLYT